MGANLAPVVARKTWRTLEPIHGAIYFAPGADYRDLGMRGQMGYFASRAAPLGPVPAEVVVATFYNFNPGLVRSCIPAAWEIATPATLLAARLALADAMLSRVPADLMAGAAPAAALARAAAEAAVDRPEGRPLFAAHAALPWPDGDPRLVLWHAQTLLREFRGDGHIAALATAGLDGIEALVAHAASGEIPAALLRATRAWDEAAWHDAVEGLRRRDLVTGEGDAVTLTAAGAALRQRIEDTTDQLAAPAYAAIGEDGCEQLRALCRPISRWIVDSGALQV